ncbi:hypothetical protein CI102_930 [Trichoderma harzianum]|nr:hypothetical protein CI102_930 [Trichoderma harzianum]
MAAGDGAWSGSSATAPCYWASPDVLAAVLDIDRPLSVTETFYFCLVIRTDRRYSYMSFGGEEKKLQLSKATPDHHFHNTEPITGPPQAQKNAQGCVCAVFVRAFTSRDHRLVIRTRMRKPLFSSHDSGVAMHRPRSIGHTGGQGGCSKIPRATKALPKNTYSVHVMFKSAVSSPQALLVVTFIRDSVTPLPISDHLLPTWAR